jgi:hypothetical protein
MFMDFEMDNTIMDKHKFREFLQNIRIPCSPGHLRMFHSAVLSSLFTHSCLVLSFLKHMNICANIPLHS